MTGAMKRLVQNPVREKEKKTLMHILRQNIGTGIFYDMGVYN